MSTGASFTLCGSELTGAHLGKTIRFVEIDSATKVETIVTGELRGITHNESSVSIDLGTRYSGARRHFDLGAKQVFVLNPDAWQVSDITLMRNAIS